MVVKSLLYVAMFLILNNAWGQDALLLEETSPDYSGTLPYQLHTKLQITPRCDLYILLNQKDEKLWFVELVNRSIKTKTSLEIMDVIDFQEKYLPTVGYVIDINDWVSNFKTFRYIEKNDTADFTLYFTDKHDKDKSSDLSLRKIYNAYIKYGSTFVWDDSTRNCLDEDL